jgi:hypothetical protein
MNRPKFDIFISYSRQDFDEVNAMVSRIKESSPNINIWFDVSGIESGDEFQEKIISAIDNSGIVLFALSENSIFKSKWTKKEIMYAKNTSKRIIPVLLKGAELKGWFLFEFGTIDCVDITIDLQWKKLIKNLSDWFPTQNLDKTEYLWRKIELNQITNVEELSSITPEVITRLRRRAEIDCNAQYYLGLCYFYGYGVNKKYSEAVRCFWDAQFTHYGAKFYLGLCYYNGYGVIKDYGEALIYFHEIDCDMADYYVDALYYIGLCYYNGYYNGLGWEKNKSVAIGEFRCAAEQGSIDAHKMLKTIDSRLVSITPMKIDYQVMLDRIKQNVHEMESTAQIYLHGVSQMTPEISAWNVYIISEKEELTDKEEERFMDNMCNLIVETGQMIYLYVFGKQDWLTSLATIPPYQKVQKEGIKL